MTTATVVVSMRSDWIVGSGRGRAGGIDATVQRDADGLPYIPAKTLTGVLRDAAERVVAIVEPGADGPWHEWLVWTFGAQPAAGQAAQPAHLSIRPARLSTSLRAAVSADPDLCAALTFLKPSVAIDPATGAAAPGALRLEERAIAGLTLHARLELDDAELPAGVTAPWDLLALAAAEAHHLGANRRRGAGRCDVTISGPASRSLDAALAALDAPGSPPADQPSALSAIDLTSAQPAPWGEALLRLRCETPVLAAPTTVGNVRRSLDHVPGRTLMPALLRALGHPPGWSAAVRRGEVSVGAATPAVDGRPAAPAPAVLYGPKSGPALPGSELANTLHGDARTGTRPLRGGFVHAAPDGVVVIQTPRTTATHAVIDDERQRPTTETGGLFTVDAIAAGTVLAATVRGPVELLDELRQLEGQHLRVGAAKKDDYGDVVVEAVEIQRSDDTPTPSATDDLVVWLESELLVRDARLRPSTDPRVVADVLSAALGVEVAPHPDGAATGATAVRIDGWRSRWDLPHASLVGLGPGTVLRFRCRPTPDPQRLAAVERTGLGERTAEGFGRVRLNDPLLMRTEPLTVVERAGVEGRAVEAAGGEGATDGADREILHVLTVNALRRRIDAAAVRRGDELAALVRTPTRSQAGRLREAAAALTGPDPDEACRRLRALAKTHRLRDLEALLDRHSHAVWERLWIDPAPEGSHHRAAQEQLWPLAVQRLLLEALRAAVRTEIAR